LPLAFLSKTGKTKLLLRNDFIGVMGVYISRSTASNELREIISTKFDEIIKVSETRTTIVLIVNLNQLPTTLVS